MSSIILESSLRSFVLGVVLWLVVRAFRLRGASMETTIWTVFLAGALAMPVLVHLSPLSLPLKTAPWAASALIEPVVPTMGDDTAAGIIAPEMMAKASAAAQSALTPVDWARLATDAYLAVAAALLLRTLVGLVLMQRTRMRAQPIFDICVGNSDVRVSAAVAAPVTFGATILLPAESSQWAPAQWRAVLAHERAHVAAGDFYVHLFAVLHRAIFWFSPMSWWLLYRLATLAETMSDAAAIDSLGDRTGYAAILLDIAGRARPAPFGVAMAQDSRLTKRLDSILSTTKTEPVLHWRKKAIVALTVMPAIVIAAGAIAQDAPPAAPAPGQTQASAGTMSAAASKKLSPYLGAYRLDPVVQPDTVITLSLQGDRFIGQATGGRAAEVFAKNDDDFVFQGRRLRIRNVMSSDGKVDSFEFLWRGRYLTARRIDDSEAKRIADLYAQRLAEQEAPHKVVAVDPKLFDDYVGYYQLSDQKVFSVTREGDHLFNQTTGQHKFEIFPDSEREFFYTISAAQVSFEPDSQGRAGALILHQSGHERRAPRIEQAAADKINAAYAERLAQEVRPHNLASVDPKVFDGYVGKYQLNPSTVMTATREGDKLFMQLTGQKKFELFPESESEYFYTIVAAQISFHTDDAGRATQLVLHQNGWDQVAERLD